MNLEQQIQDQFDFSNVVYEHLNTPTNDVLAVATPTDKFALKLYNIQSRTAKDVQWELDLDNVHRHGDRITVFDFDSAGECWRSIEPYGVLISSKEYFEAWLDGYRSVRPFNLQDEKAVAAFGIIGDLRGVAWKLGLARSSRGKPLLGIADLPGVVDTWLDWEQKNINYHL